MATEQHIKPLIQSLEKALEYQQKDMIRRNQWGSITFEKASHDLERIFAILAHLRVLPLEHLTDQAAAQIKSELDQVVSHLDSIDKFNIEQANPTQVRDSLVNAVHQRADQFYTVATPWIPFLAYQKGDVSKNIEALTKSVSDANTLVERAKEDITQKHKEIGDIIVRAREASASAGAAVFTQDFSREATSLADSATKWLWGAATLALATLLAAGLMWYFSEPGLDYGQLTQRFGTKVAVLVVLFTATVWCGRNYRALMHQSAVNKHRALSLQTFQAFSAAAADSSAKDAVLMETTRAIFAGAATGYLDPKSGGHESDVRVIEIAKSPVVVKAIETAAKSSAT
jgi:hypothetical protein